MLGDGWSGIPVFVVKIFISLTFLRWLIFQDGKFDSDRYSLTS